ncbi:hypothetical protein L0337_30340 [candidate division KSB1 bacterium]|nr:hypothetical protein [candidate division KSB1 bacterium]
MSTIKDKDETFDYQAYTRENAPDPAKIQRGPEARRQRLEAAIMKSVLRIDKDILQQFKQLAPSDQECQRLINQALREWLSAKDVKELVRAELQQVVRQALALIESKAELPKSSIERPLAVDES